MARRRFELTDEQFEQIEDLLPEIGGHGRPQEDYQKVTGGLFWISRTGCPKRDLPDRYGEWWAAHDRFRTWCEDGTLDRILDWLQKELDLRDEIDWEQLGAHGTTVPARRAAAGGPLGFEKGTGSSEMRRKAERK